MTDAPIRDERCEERKDGVAASSDTILPNPVNLTEQDDLTAFLSGWSESGPWWPTAIPRDGGNTQTRTFTDLAALAAWVEERVGNFNLYFSVNDLSLNTNRKARKDAVTRIRGLHVDVDARVPDGGWPTELPTSQRLTDLAAHTGAERERIRKLVVDGVGWPASLPRPTAIVDSGGGFQCFWRLQDDEDVPPELAERLNV